jgi:uncharacterized membrane protein YbhN (UPF0104 family)
VHDRVRRRLRGPLAWWLGGAVAVLAAVGVVRVVDGVTLGRALRAAVTDPVALGLVVVVYGTAFLLRAVAWRRIVPNLSVSHALAAIHVSLAGNHVLPLRLGEALRVTTVVRRAGIGLAEATASTVALRAADVVAVGGLATLLGPAVLVGLGGPWVVAGAVGAVGALAAGTAWLVRLRRTGRTLRLPGPTVGALTVTAWLLEAVVIWQAAAWAGVHLTTQQAVLVTAVTIAAQTLAIAPGGFGTYEAAGTAALVTLGVDPGTGLAIVLTAHAIKTAYALAAGAVGLVRPRPSVLGRVRLAPAQDRPSEPAPEGPVVLFVPAHDEQDSVGAVVRRAPAHVAGREVRFVVVDDGSTDATAAVAEAAGAEVVRLPHNRGLGAAVRVGFAHALAQDAAVVAFCDADGEYAPEELERLVTPILAGEADYVIGSRFDGDIERMLPHRRWGNLALTLLLRFVSRTAISDGQSGYRALSRDAAAAAEIIHDFNYAQVLTLDLLAKGFRYAEVPITYRFRETGRSFVRLGPYLRAVGPAVWRQLNT